MCHTTLTNQKVGYLNWCQQRWNANRKGILISYKFDRDSVCSFSNELCREQRTFWSWTDSYVFRYGTRRPLFTSTWRGSFPQLNHHIMHWLNHSAACQAQTWWQTKTCSTLSSKSPASTCCAPPQQRLAAGAASTKLFAAYDRVTPPAVHAWPGAGAVGAAAAAAQAPAPAAPAFPFRYFSRCLWWFLNSKFKLGFDGSYWENLRPWAHCAGWPYARATSWLFLLGCILW